MVVNLIAYLFAPGGLGLRDRRPAGDRLQPGRASASARSRCCSTSTWSTQAIRRGAPAKFAWYVSFGLLVTLVWLYLEILRLLSYFRD